LGEGHLIGNDREDVLIDLQREYLPTQPDSVETVLKQSRFDLKSLLRDSVSVQAEDVRRTLEEYAKDGHPEAQLTQEQSIICA